MENKQNNSEATKIISIDKAAVKDKLNEVARDTVEETLAVLLDKEAERLCNARK